MEEITKQNVTEAEQKQKRGDKYRSISLINRVAKICETAVKKIVLTHCENNCDFGEMKSV